MNKNIILAPVVALLLTTTLSGAAPAEPPTLADLERAILSYKKERDVALAEHWAASTRDIARPVNNGSLDLLPQAAIQDIEDAQEELAEIRAAPPKPVNLFRVTDKACDPRTGQTAGFVCHVDVTFYKHVHVDVCDALIDEVVDTRVDEIDIPAPAGNPTWRTLLDLTDWDPWGPWLYDHIAVWADRDAHGNWFVRPLIESLPGPTEEEFGAAYNEWVDLSGVDLSGIPLIYVCLAQCKLAWPH